MNTEGQQMEKYKSFVVPMVNNKITGELESQAPKDPATKNNKIEKSRYDLDDKEAPKESLSPSDKIEKAKKGLVVPSAEKYKKTTEYTKT